MMIRVIRENSSSRIIIIIKIVMVENEILYSIQYSCDAFTDVEELQKKGKLVGIG